MHILENSRDYTDEDKPKVFEKVRKEQNLYYKRDILKMSADKGYIEVTHTTNHNIPWHSFNDGKFEGAKVITKEIKY